MNHVPNTSIDDHILAFQGMAASNKAFFATSIKSKREQMKSLEDAAKAEIAHIKAVYAELMANVEIEISNMLAHAEYLGLDLNASEEPQPNDQAG